STAHQERRTDAPGRQNELCCPRWPAWWRWRCPEHGRRTSRRFSHEPGRAVRACASCQGFRGRLSGRVVPQTTIPLFLLSAKKFMYRCEAASVEGFVQQLAVSYLVHGYWYYVTGYIPEHKDPRAVDQKLLTRYGIGLSKWSRARRKQAGGAN